MIINKFISIILATVVLKKHSNKLKQKKKDIVMKQRQVVLSNYVNFNFMYHTCTLKTLKMF